MQLNYFAQLDAQDVHSALAHIACNEAIAPHADEHLLDVNVISEDMGDEDRRDIVYDIMDRTTGQWLATVRTIAACQQWAHENNARLHFPQIAAN